MAIHRVKDGYVISSRQVWLPGIYDSERTARAAFRKSDEALSALNDRICNINGENRAITAEDLRGIK